MLISNKGSQFLSLVNPIFSTMLVFMEPFFLMIEVYIAIDMIKSFNKWISTHANVRDEASQDLSNWEPPLTRTSLLVRTFVVLISIFSYIATYVLIQESKFLLSVADQVPINFNHAFAALVTLQVIAFSATIYKDEGILSESAMVALLAAVPIFIASWSYHNLRQTSDSSR